MGLGVTEDALRRAVGHQLPQDKSVAGVPGAGIQLAVGEGARAPLAELDVGLEIQLAGGPEPLHVLRPLLHRLAPLQQNGSCPAAGQGQGAEQAPRSRAHHHRGNIRRLYRRRQAVALLLRPGHLAAAAPAEDFLLVLHLYPQGVHQADRLPGVHRPAEDGQRLDLSRRKAEDSRRLLPQAVLALLQGEDHTFDLQHDAAPFRGTAPQGFCLPR